MIGWAFAKFRRPLINIKFWLICILSAALHYIFDFPYGAIFILTLALSFGVGLALIVIIIKKERKAEFAQAVAADNQSEPDVPAESGAN